MGPLLPDPDRYDPLREPFRPVPSSAGASCERSRLRDVQTVRTAGHGAMDRAMSRDGVTAEIESKDRSPSKNVKYWDWVRYSTLGKVETICADVALRGVL